MGPIYLCLPDVDDVLVFVEFGSIELRLHGQHNRRRWLHCQELLELSLHVPEFPPNKTSLV